MSNSLTKSLKMELWRRFGTLEHPAEWDGIVYGGGKLSQRYWEYFKTIEMLDLNSSSVVLDVGGGSPVLGMGFFSSLLSKFVKKVVIMDPEIKFPEKHPSNVEFIKINSTYEELKKVLISRPEITHISSVSVFEHIDGSVRNGIIQAIDEFFQGDNFVTTFEFHASKVFFESQLTARSTSELFSGFKNFYLEEMESSPVWCENAFERNKELRLSCDKTRLGRVRPFVDTTPVPEWYPVATKFCRIPSKI